MRIIKKGTIKAKKYKCVCPKCNTILEIDDKDIQGSQYPLVGAYGESYCGTGYEYHVDCPICKKTILLKDMCLFDNNSLQTKYYNNFKEI